jgi:hypothetical protein
MAVNRRWTWSLGIAGLAFAVLFGKWAQSLFTQSELMHFSVNFPGAGRAQTMSCCDLGGPWARTRDPDWSNYASGGLLTWGEEGQIVVDVGQQGLIKRTLQPNFLSLSSHWIRNVGTQPYQIRIEMDMCGMDLEWETFERDWDPVGHTSTRAINPGDTYNMDWYFRLSEQDRNRSVICDGQLSLFDAQTGSLLTELPIKIVNSRAS